MNQLLKWKVKFIIPEPQNRLLWLYKFTSYSLVWALTPDLFPPAYLQVKAPKEKTEKHSINGVVKPSWKKDYLLEVKKISANANVIKLNFSQSNMESYLQKSLH